MSCKRSYTDQDPDYENDLSNDQKRLKVIEKGNKEATVRKIQQIVTSQFNHEAKLKEAEAKEIDDALYQTLKMLDQLRACAVTSFYSFERPCEAAVMKISGSQPPIHPTVKKFIGKRPKLVSASSSCSSNLPSIKDSGTDTLITSTFIKPSADKDERNFKNILSPVVASPPPALPLPPPPPSLTSLPLDDGSRGSRFKIKKRVVVGNVSKYIPVDKREESDQSTHKWMLYVRGPKEEPFIETFVKKVWFFLHPSYRPNDLVEVSHPPFHLTRRGWGEFPVRIQLHFHNTRNKRVDIIHTLKLDKTYTGLQTLGSETVVDVSIFKPDLHIGDMVGKCEKNDAKTTPNSVIPHDIGGISIPAEVNSCALEALLKSPNKLHLLPLNSSESFSVPKVEDTFDKHKDAEVIVDSKKSPEFTTILPRNHFKIQVKQEVLEDSDEKVSDKFLNSFINDHGAYFNPTIADLVNSKPSVAVFDHTLNEDLSKQRASVSSHVTIKEEPLDEADYADLSLPNILSTSCSSPVKKEMSKNADLMCIDQSVSAGLNKCTNETGPVTINKDRSVSSMPADQQTHLGLSCDDLILKSFEESKSDMPTIKNQDLKLIPNQHFDTASRVNNLPVLFITQKSQIPSSSASSVTTISIKTPINKLIPANSVNTLRLQSPGVTGEPGKSDGQSQVSNGVPTFVKCVNKQGNLFLISLDKYLERNPGAQTSILQSAIATSSSSSLLKPLSKTQMTVISSVNHNQNTALTKAPSIVNLPASASSNSMQQSLLTNSKMLQIAQTNNRSLLLPQNSVSLLAGSQRMKLQLGGVSCTLSAKTMVKKNRIAANSKAQTSSESKEIPSLNVDIFETMDGILRALVKMFPIFAQNPDRILHPYCAPSLMDFLNWNVGKRHAAEWQRARAIRNKILQLIPNSTKWESVTVWPVKRLLIWCRHHGYSPMKMVDKDEECDETNESKELANADKFSTYTEPNQLLETLNKEPESEKEEEKIDIITIEEKPKLKTACSPEKSAVNVLHLPSSTCGEFIRETVEQIGLKLLPEEVCTNTVAPLAEEVLLAAMKQFAEEILSSSVAEAIKRNGNKRCPSIIKSLHVGNAIRDLPQCDFLTNNCLGTSILKNHFSNMVNVKL